MARCHATRRASAEPLMQHQPGSPLTNPAIRDEQTSTALVGEQFRAGGKRCQEVAFESHLKQTTRDVATPIVLTAATASNALHPPAARLLLLSEMRRERSTWPASLSACAISTSDRE